VSAKNQERKISPSVIGWLLAAMVILTAGLIIHPYRAQQASRYALTAAIVEQRTVVLDDYTHVLGRDRSVRNGHVYSDKAPGQPLLAVPFYALGRAVGSEPATVLRIEGNLGVWWVTLWTATIPGALLIMLMYRQANRVDPEIAPPVTVSLFFGSLLFPFSALLFGHVLAALFLFGAFLAMSGDLPNRGRLVMAGALAGAAVVTEYTTILGVVILLGYVLWRHRRSWWLVVLGSAPMAVSLAIYNQVAFGSPWTLSYQFTAFTDVTDSARSLNHMFTTPALDNLILLLFSGRGLLIATPIVAIAIAGAIIGVKGRHQAECIVALLMASAFLLLPVFWGNPWGGASPGPRYVTPMLPFLTVPLVIAWQRWHRLSVGAALLSVLTMALATFSDPILERDVIGGLGSWLRLLAKGTFVDSVVAIGLGWWGWVLHGAIVVCIGVAIALLSRGAVLASTKAAGAMPSVKEPTSQGGV
jgi:hypothetical protein